jgi:MIP family channel proteins
MVRMLMLLIIAGVMFEAGSAADPYLTPEGNICSKVEHDSSAQLKARVAADGSKEGELDATVMLQSPEPRVQISSRLAEESIGARKSSHSAQEADVELSAVFAEYLAMTLFVVIGCGSAMGSAKEPGWILQVALTFGFAITSLAYAVGHYSGGQINCAVTLGLYLSGNLSASQAIFNFVAQMLGSITGALLLTGITGEESDKTNGLARNKVAPGYTQGNALVGEACMTFLLMFVVLETAINPDSAANRSLACVAIGFAVFLAHCVLIPIDGCSINPTRTFGPALISKMFYKKGCEDSLSGDQWVFWLGPLSGAACAVLVSHALKVSASLPSPLFYEKI